jgi:hypothetical protein
VLVSINESERDVGVGCGDHSKPTAELYEDAAHWDVGTGMSALGCRRWDVGAGMSAL